MRLLRGIAYGLVLAAGGGIFYGTFVWYQYWDQLPRSPQPVQGRTYRVSLHGVIVYATYEERERLDVTEDVSIALMVVGIAAAILTSEDYWQKMGWRYPEKPEAPLQSGPSPPTSGSEGNESEQSH